MGAIEASIPAPAKGALRVIMRQYGPDGRIPRTSGGAPPNGENMGKVFTIEATQEGRSIPVQIDYGRIIWSGLSWAAGEIKAADLAPGKPVLIRIHSAAKEPVTLEGAAYRVVY